MRGPPLRAAAVLAVVSSPPPSVATGCVARLQLDGGIRLGGRLNWPRRGGGLLLAPHRARKNGWVMAVPVQFLMGSGLHVLCAIVMQHALTEQSSCPPRDVVVGAQRTGGQIRCICGSTAVLDGFVDASCDVLDGCVAGSGGRARLVGRFQLLVPYPCRIGLIE